VRPPKVILLHADDNVVVCIAPITAGDNLTIDDAEMHAAQDVGVGHKIARTQIAPGQKILKYGAPIGSATQAIAPGEWVHMHNMKSDYIPAHGRGAIAGAAA
jgi:D-threo-aldose 1-dehydrogenase